MRISCLPPLLVPRSTTSCQPLLWQCRLTVSYLPYHVVCFAQVQIACSAATCHVHMCLMTLHPQLHDNTTWSCSGLVLLHHPHEGLIVYKTPENGCHRKVSAVGLTQYRGVYMLLQGEIANRRATQNNFVRQLGDISRTLKSMGLHHQIQVRASAAQPCSAQPAEACCR